MRAKRSKSKRNKSNACLNGSGTAAGAAKRKVGVGSAFDDEEDDDDDDEDSDDDDDEDDDSDDSDDDSNDDEDDENQTRNAATKTSLPKTKPAEPLKSQFLSTTSIDDPILVTHAKCISEGILCSWKRRAGGSTRQPVKELWIFWFENEPPPNLKSLLSRDLVVSQSDSSSSYSQSVSHPGGGGGGGLFDQAMSSHNGLPYEARSMLFKALHSLIERSLLDKGYARLGKWFVMPYNLQAVNYSIYGGWIFNSMATAAAAVAAAAAAAAATSAAVTSTNSNTTTTDGPLSSASTTTAASQQPSTPMSTQQSPATPQSVAPKVNFIRIKTYLFL